MNKQKLLFLTFMQNDRGRSSVGLTLSLVEGSHQQHKDMPRLWGSILQNTMYPAWSPGPSAHGAWLGYSPAWVRVLGSQTHITQRRQS